ncbi:DUF4209 domain-containing protein [Achromobacter insuavis]|uniref:DUF4209 domain-containing protein n=1 Tax=Achromobacter insuavis TaxID=1287735 RepID=UPI000E301738|nr:DUF4209 domain-containing protein [Achromobacter insuavis]
METQQDSSQDCIFTPEMFSACGWKPALDAAQIGYPAMWEALRKEANAAAQDSRSSHSALLSLIAKATSLMLVPTSLNEPFKPFAVFADRRSASLEDFTEAEIKLFAEVLDLVEDSWLKARFADMAWLRMKPRNPNFANIAIDCYRSIPLSFETWIHGGDNCWRRAFVLAQQLKAGAGERLDQMQKSVLTAFHSTSIEDGYFPIRLADLLGTLRQTPEIATDIASKLEDLASAFNQEGKLREARDHYSASAQWYRKAKAQEKAAAMMKCKGEMCERAATAMLAMDPPQALSAASLYENAIEAYREIPNQHRAEHDIEARIAKIRTQLNEAGSAAIGQMHTITTPGVDLAEVVDMARNAVENRDPYSALQGLCSFPGMKVETQRTAAIKAINHSFFSSMFGMSMLSADGRVVARIPPVNLGGTDADNEPAIQAHMVRDSRIFVQMTVLGIVLPALDIIRFDHRLQELDFVHLASLSRFVPSGRERLIGKALFAGYDNDFVAALHFLVPQMENAVRVHLKAAGAKTSTLDSQNIEMENGLSTLMDLPEAVNVFGGDLAYEIRAIFCDAFGPNLRNELAHGLLDENGCDSEFSIYAWWLLLRLVILSIAPLADSHENAVPEGDGETNVPA